LTYGDQSQSDSERLAADQRIGAVCDQFESEWCAGRRPKIDAYLSQVLLAEIPVLLKALIALDVSYRRRLEEDPRIDQYVLWFPQNANSVREVFAELENQSNHVPEGATITSVSNDESPSTIELDGRTTPARIGPYKVLGLLGSGATGLVYRARNVQDDTIVAVKILSEAASRRENTQRRFIREMTAMSKLNHPNVVRYLDCGLHEDQFYCVMELVGFQTLKQKLSECQRFRWQEAVDFGVQICAALEHAHAANIIHRDLKPANLFVSEKGLVKLGDFGLARDNNEVTMTREGQTMGTCLYMAPEQIMGGRDISTSVDLYALGCLLHQAVDGKPPFCGDSMMEIMQQHCSAERPDLNAGQADCPLELATLIKRLMARSPDDRPLNAAAVKQELIRVQKKYRNQDEHSVFVDRQIWWAFGFAILLGTLLIAVLMWFQVISRPF